MVKYIMYKYIRAFYAFREAKKTMKRTFTKILSVVLCAVMVLGATPLGGLVGLDLPGLFDFKAEAATYSGTCGTNLTWSLDTETGVLNITGTGAMTNYSSYSSVPWYSYRSKIKTVNIASGVTTIGDYAFYSCNSLTSVTIGNSVTTIGNSAFYNCGNLTSVTIPDSVTTIGNFAFLWCENLTSITIPDSVTTIGYEAFKNCDSLTSITVDKNNKIYSSDSYGVLFNKDETTLIQYPAGNTRTSYTIPNSVTTIGNDAFKNCDSLTSVTIGNSVTTIGNYAFDNCDSLTSVTISNSVTTIGDYAFLSCTSLASIKIPGSVKIISWDAFKDCTGLTSAIIGNGVTTIDSGVFAGCTSLTSVTIPNSVKSIGDSAFSGCTSLASIKIPDSVNSIGDNAFAGCDKLTNVIIPDSLTSIIWCTFYSCDSLANVIIGNSVTTIGERAFYWCTGLTSITIPGSVTTIGYYAFDNCNSLTDIYYMGSESQWKSISIKAYNSALRNAKIHYNHIHELNNVIESVDPTCTETGYKTGTCVCGYGIITEEIPALNHKDTLVKVAAKAPTCTEIGWDAYEYCTACTYTTYKEKAALKHDIVIDKAVDATCTETGLTEGHHCSRCDDETIKQEVVPVKPHNYTAKHDSAKHWEECNCGSKTNIQNHTFVGGNVCACGFKRTVDSTVKIKNNSGAKTINYGETLKLMATVTDKPANAKIYWYVDGEQKGEGEIFEVKFESGTKIITVKLVDENGVVYQNANGEEISENENVTVNAGFFQKLISFFKNLFRMNRTVVQ